MKTREIEVSILLHRKKTRGERENYICQKTNSISSEIFLFNFDIYKKIEIGGITYFL
jgi:hypothetical protein